MNTIKFNTLGKIIKGDNKGWYVFVDPVHDEKNNQPTGHYILLIGSRNDFVHSDNSEAYDYWMESLENLQDQMNYFNWEIEWLDTLPT